MCLQRRFQLLLFFLCSCASHTISLFRGPSKQHYDIKKLCCNETPIIFKFFTFAYSDIKMLR